MAQQIVQERCTQCGVCMDACPNDGIEEIDGTYVILSGLCTECYGFNSTPQCSDVCPVEAIAEDPLLSETESEVAYRAAFLHPERMPRD